MFATSRSRSASARDPLLGLVVAGLVRVKLRLQHSGASRRVRAVPDELWSLVHRDFGPISTFVTREAAEEDLAAVLRDEPSWSEDLGVERYEFK